MAARPTRRNLFGLGERKPTPKRRSAGRKRAPEPKPSLTRRALGSVVRHFREVATMDYSRTRPASIPSGTSTPRTRQYTPVAQRQDAAERRRAELHELKVQRAAASLRLAQERAMAVAERRAEQAERARSRAEKERLRSLAKTQEHKADELEGLERKVLAGTATEGEIRYWFEKSGARVGKARK